MFLNDIYEMGERTTKGSEALTAAPAKKSNSAVLMAIAPINNRH